MEGMLVAGAFFLKLYALVVAAADEWSYYEANVNPECCWNYDLHATLYFLCKSEFVDVATCPESNTTNKCIGTNECSATNHYLITCFEGK